MRSFRSDGVIGAISGAIAGGVGGAGASQGNVIIREDINMTLKTMTVSERLSKDVISRALRTGAVKSGIYGIATSPLIDRIKKWRLKDEEVDEEEECTCAD